MVVGTAGRKVGGSAAVANVALRISDPVCVPGAEGERDGDRTEEGEEEEEGLR